jgi:hypothetical protein
MRILLRLLLKGSVQHNTYSTSFSYLDLSQKVDSVKEENLKLRSENQVLGQYIENLLAASTVFQPTTSTAARAKKKLVFYSKVNSFILIFMLVINFSHVMLVFFQVFRKQEKVIQ